MKHLDNIQNLIYIIRGQRVMLDFDLARIYQVETKTLNQAVKRNMKRFEGEEFMFRLSKEEWNVLKADLLSTYSVDNKDITNLRSQFVTSNWGGTRYQPYAFTEIGVAMLSSVLRSEVAIFANRKIMKAFVCYRHLAEMPLAATYLELRKQIEELKTEVNEILADQNEINEHTRAQLDAISMVLSELQASESASPSRPIGFIRPTEEEEGNKL